MSYRHLAATAVIVSLAISGCSLIPTAEQSSGSSAADTTDMAAKTAVAANPFAKPGFDVNEKDGRLWVLKEGEKESEKHVTMIGAGPNGMTIKALNNETALEYLATKPGFNVHVKDGRLWVLRDGQKESEKHVTAIGAGLNGMTIKALDQDTLNAYLSAK